MFIRLRHILTAFGPDAIRLNIASIVGSLPIGYKSIVLPIYFSKVGLDSTLIGQLSMVSSVSSAVLLIFFGLLADRFGRKPFVILGTALPIVSYGILLTTQDALMLYIAAALGGVGLANGVSGALASSSFNALLAEKVNDRNRNAVFSVTNGGWTAALMVGSLLGGMPEWLQHEMGMNVVASYQPLFWIALITAIAGTLILLPVTETHRAHFLPLHTDATSISHRTLRTTVKLAVFMGLLGLGLGFGIQMLPLWFYLRYGVSGDILGPWYAAGELGSTLSMLVVPPLARRLGDVRFVLLTQGSSALAMIGMVISPIMWVGATLSVFRSTLVNMSWPIQQSYMMGIVQPRERATVNSATLAAWGLASAISPVFSGMWLDQRRLALPLLAGAASYLMSALVLYAHFRHVRPTGAMDVEPLTSRSMDMDHLMQDN